jgi:hypothetical protein
MAGEAEVLVRMRHHHDGKHSAPCTPGALCAGLLLA